MLPFVPLDLANYVSENGERPFADWFDTLHPAAADRVTRALERMSAGNLSNIKAVGGSRFRASDQLGAGYRVYFGRDGLTLVV